ncbi:MAG: glycosyltransferase, partial [Thermoprotei archaeon]
EWITHKDYRESVLFNWMHVGRFIYIRPFSDRPRTGGELVMEEIYGVLKEYEGTRLIVIRRPQESNRSVPFLSTFRYFVYKNGLANRLVQDGYEVYGASKAGTIEYVQPAPKPATLTSYAARRMVGYLELMSRANASNVRLAVYNSEYSLRNHRIGSAKKYTIIYPPLFKSYDFDPAKKQNIVVTISRIVPSKKLEFVGRASEHVRAARFCVLGFLNPSNAGYLSRLTKRFPALEVYPNAPEALKSEILSKAKVYLHPPTDESFLISKLEAMSAGVVPVVPLSGGIHEGVPKEQVYRDFDGMVDLVKNSLSSYNVERGRLFMDLARNYSLANFRRRLKHTLDDYMGLS